MQKTVILLLIFIVSAFLVSRLAVPATSNLLSPLGKKEEQGFLQKIIDDRVFEKNKHKIVAKPVDWARGGGKPHPLVVSSGYVVVNNDGDVVYALNPDAHRAPASLIKLMTVMVVLDFANLDEKFSVPSEAVGMEPTTLMVDEGERFSVRELLGASLITSANDAAYVLAAGVAKKLGGSPELFVKFMNEKAKNLGLEGTHFANATGYDDPEQYSTARDLVKMTKYALDNYPVIKEIVAIRSSRIDKNGDHKSYELPNWNALLGVYPGVDGVKIGYTGDAGYVTIVTAEREEERFLVVLLGTPDRRARDLWAAQLLNAAFSQKGVAPFRVTLNMLQKRSAEWGEQLQRAAAAAGN